MAGLQADILVHTGDFCDSGSAQEWEDFNAWLGEIKGGFARGVYVVLGNHDYKFLDALTDGEALVGVMASDEKRRTYLQGRLSNGVVLDNELLKVGLGGDLEVTLYGCPWNPFQSSPTYPDRVRAGRKVKSDHDRVFLKWAAGLPETRRKRWPAEEAWRYDEIPTDGSVDVLLTHVPPYGVFDQMPWFVYWGSSEPLRQVLEDVKPRMHLFGHVHAQRGYWEKVQGDIHGGVQYATTTNEEVKTELMKGDAGIQLLANTALMSDRTVQPFAKKGIAGKPRLIEGYWIADPALPRAGYWSFHCKE
uniref:Calcineurin-like phosphoesterase domain-containing protein n=1 Tax=Arcella intermedia TaxID=1963864 RepID=A0A6B2L9T5_9EUKA